MALCKDRAEGRGAERRARERRLCRTAAGSRPGVVLLFRVGLRTPLEHAVSLVDGHQDELSDSEE